MQRRAVIQVITLAIVLSQSAGDLVIAPRSTESKVGETTYFNCSTNLTSKEIFWNHGDKYIYTGHGIIDPYRERFDIERSGSNGSHNLVIHSVESSDAGEYTCIDDDGHGKRRSAELVVLDNDPYCRSNIQPDGVIGQNIFNIPTDEVQLTCNVTYHGKIPPQMEWKKVGDNSSVDDSSTSIITSTNRLIYTLKFTGDIALDNSSYVCQTTRSTQNQYKCTSEIVKVLYFVGGNETKQNVMRGDEITCIVSNSTFPCISQWYHDNYTCPSSCDKAITAHLLGEYLCKIKCHVRGKDYDFEALKAVVAEATTSPPPSLSGTVAALIVIPIVIIIILLPISVAVYITRDNKQKHLLREMELKERSDKKKQEKTEYKVAEEEIELLYKPKKVGTSEEKKISGVAILGEALFLLREESSSLEVYDRNNFNLLSPSLNVNEVVAAVDICSCKTNKCLYIMDTMDTNAVDSSVKIRLKFWRKFKARKVFKIDADGLVLKKIMKWSTKDDACGFLSATAEGNVIITVQDNHLLLEYSSDGKLVREIKLLGCNRPWHAIKQGNDHYIVSHGTYDRLHRVCVVDEKGNVEKSFGREMGSTEYQLHIPYYLAVGNNGCVFVADLCNNRVLLLDSNLKIKTKIVPEYKQGFRSPRRIYLDENLGRLVVVIDEGIPRKKIPVETCDLREEKELIDILTENDYPRETSGGETHDSRKETEEGATLKGIDDPKITIHVEADDSLEKTEEDDRLIEKDYTKDIICRETYDSRKKIVDNDKATLSELLDLLRILKKRMQKWMKEVKVSKRIEEDCRLLVFDIKPLLQKYDG